MTITTLLWSLQWLLALLFLLTGTMLMLSLGENLITRAAWAKAFSVSTVKLVGLLEVLGAVGLIVPMITGI